MSNIYIWRGSPDRTLVVKETVEMRAASLLLLVGTVMLHSARGSMNTNGCDRAQRDVSGGIHRHSVKLRAEHEYLVWITMSRDVFCCDPNPYVNLMNSVLKTSFHGNLCNYNMLWLVECRAAWKMLPTSPILFIAPSALNVYVAKLLGLTARSAAVTLLEVPPYHCFHVPCHRPHLHPCIHLYALNVVVSKGGAKNCCFHSPVWQSETGACVLVQILKHCH